MKSKYLADLGLKIAEAKVTDRPQFGMTSAGYTKRSGAPTSIMVRLAGEKRWRRLMVWQFSNSGTCFIRRLGETIIINDCDIP